MSEGNFDSGKYERDNGIILKCRPQAETKEASLASQTNSYPSGSVTAGNNGFARLRGSRRRFGVHARFVTIRWTAGPPIGYKDDQLLQIPIFRKAAFDAIIAADPATGTYLGTACEVVSYSPERVR